MCIHVAVAVIINNKNQVLITQRSAKQHQGNKWEFPGGKVEKGETSQQALYRELKEELGIKIKSANFLIDIEHQYPTTKVFLAVYKVKNWSGKARGLEGQPMRWVDIFALKDYKFPSANIEILNKIS